MNISQKGIDLIKEFEGFRAQAYKCPAGVWTIAFGHTSGVSAGMTCTREQGEKWLRQDLVTCETAVTAWNYRYNWTQGEYDCLCSFTFNCGTGSLKQLLKNGARTKEEISNAILLYVKDINGRELPGLVRRRKVERELFMDKSTPTVIEKEYETVEDVCRGIWNGDFGTPWSKSDLLYKYFLKQINKGVGKNG